MVVKKWKIIFKGILGLIISALFLVGFGKTKSKLYLGQNNLKTNISWKILLNLLIIQ